LAAKGRGRHQTTVVLVGMQVDQWEGLFRKGRQSALWGLALELMASTGEHRPWVDARGDPVAIEWILRGALRDGPPWVPTPR